MVLTRKYQTCLSAASSATELTLYSLGLKPAFLVDVQAISLVAMHGLMPGKAVYCTGEYSQSLIGLILT
jgi:hypothetical protein